MLDAELIQILEMLLKKSEQGQIRWVSAAAAGMEDTTGMSDDFVVLMPNSSINVFRMADGTPRVNFLDAEGEVSASIEGSTSHRAEVLEKLLDSAKRRVFRIDETLEDIKRALSTDGVIGSTEPRSFPGPDIGE